MSAITIQQMADRVSSLMEERLRVGGVGLSAKLKKGGRLLPRKVRAAAQELANAADMAQSPKLLVQLDEEKVAEAYDLCVRHLGTVNLWDRRKGVFLGILASIFFSLLVVGALVVGVLVWRGFVQ